MIGAPLAGVPCFTRYPAIAGYAHPENLVETGWLADRLTDPALGVVEVDVDTALYGEGHVPGAVAWSWQSDLCDTVRRDIASKEALEELLGGSGIANDTTVVLYVDHDNWFACWAFWQLAIYGHQDVRILDGGRRKWIAEGRELTTDAPSVPRASYRARPPDPALRALLDDVRRRSAEPGWGLVDVRSPDEYSGRILAPAGLRRELRRFVDGVGEPGRSAGRDRARTLSLKTFDRALAVAFAA